jgi:nucleoid-associated protein YgaU
MLTLPLRVAGIALLLGLAVSQCLGQDLGELARQERARKQSQPASSPQHVYTNEDLARPQILLKEDQARLAAPGTEPAAAIANHAERDVVFGEQSVATQVSTSSPDNPEIPLGDVARHYRQAKQIRERQAEGPLPGPWVESLLARPEAPSVAPTLAPAAVQTSVVPNVVRPVGPFLAPPGNDAPLGDVARYYRWLKEVRKAQRQADAAAGEHLSLVNSTLSGAGPAPLASVRDRMPLSEATHSVHGPEPAPPRRVRVARGDSLWKLAQRYLGSGAQWRELAALNPQIVEPRRLQIGDWIRLPELASPRDVARTIRVRKGDTLWKIAAIQLGSGFAWTCVARANADLADANFILPEQVLNLPLRCEEISKGRE